MVGKYDEEGNPLIPWTGELSPTLLAPIVAARITHEFPDIRFEKELAALADSRVEVVAPTDVKRTPYFCAGCPHNTSTRVPEGSKALAGIGCHFMASWMDRDTESLIQMGGEGVNWVGKSRFCGNPHVFQNCRRLPTRSAPKGCSASLWSAMSPGNTPGKAPSPLVPASTTGTRWMPCSGNCETCPVSAC
jgi:hypothetical protein